MKRLILLLLFSILVVIAKAQKIDTTIYGVCVPPNYQKDGPFIGHDQISNPSADECPQFPGGDKSLFTFISKHIKSPKGAKYVKAVVFVNFIIEKNGKTSTCRVIHSLNTGIYTNQFVAEAIYIIKILPQWKPARVKGKPVRVEYTLPIRFPKSRA